jgi:hypothetical protein
MLVPLVEALPPEVATIFKFGQVDVEFVFNFKRIESRVAPFDADRFEEFCRRSAQSYVGFLGDHFHRRDVAVASIFPPALSDETWRAGYTNAHIAALEGDRSAEEIAAGVRLLEIPTLPERTRHHALYNAVLRELALRARLDFIDDFSPFIGADGLVDRAFTPETKGTNHHLERAPTAAIMRRIITANVARDLPARSN